MNRENTFQKQSIKAFCFDMWVLYVMKNKRLKEMEANVYSLVYGCTHCENSEDNNTGKQANFPC